MTFTASLAPFFRPSIPNFNGSADKYIKLSQYLPAKVNNGATSFP